MTTWPSFADPQFLDANGVGGLNAAMGTVSGAVAAVGSGAWAVPGLLSPEAMTVSFSGLVATIGLPRPWGLIASSGTVIRAHGTQTNADTTTYTISFASLVPSSGAPITAYLAATTGMIQQNPFPITGPPPGDPAYNPNFVPTIGYATNLYTAVLSAVSGGIDNVNLFELFRTTLTSGQTTISSYSTVGQVRAGDRKGWPGSILGAGGVLTQAQAQTIITPGASGLTFTLPLAVSAGGLTYGFAAAGYGCTVVTSGADVIAGFGSSMSVPASGAAMLWANAPSGIWDVLGVSPNMIPHGEQFISGSGTSAVTGTFTVPAGVSYIKVQAWGGGGGTGGVNADAASGGGAAGSYGEGVYGVVPGSIYTYSIGGGGLAGGNGGAGGTTTFSGTGINISVPGGNGSLGTTVGITPGGTTGGAGTGGQVNIAGSPGGSAGSTTVQGAGAGVFVNTPGQGAGAPFFGQGGFAATNTVYPGQGAGGVGSNTTSFGFSGYAGALLVSW